MDLCHRDIRLAATVRGNRGTCNVLEVSRHATTREHDEQREHSHTIQPAILVAARSLGLDNQTGAASSHKRIKLGLTASSIE
jgi:hypothetical protein